MGSDGGKRKERTGQSCCLLLFCPPPVPLQDARIIVEVHAHPMNRLEADPKAFHVSAADRVAARKALLETFVATARTLLTINRVQTRLAKARVSLKGMVPHS